MFAGTAPADAIPQPGVVEAFPPVRPATHHRAVVIVLPVVFPPALGTDVAGAASHERPVSAAGTRVGLVRRTSEDISLRGVGVEPGSPLPDQVGVREGRVVVGPAPDGHGAMVHDDAAGSDKPSPVDAPDGRLRRRRHGRGTPGNLLSRTTALVCSGKLPTSALTTAGSRTTRGHQPDWPSHQRGGPSSRRTTAAATTERESATRKDTHRGSAECSNTIRSRTPATGVSCRSISGVALYMRPHPSHGSEWQPSHELLN